MEPGKLGESLLPAFLAPAATTVPFLSGDIRSLAPGLEGFFVVDRSLISAHREAFQSAAFGRDELHWKSANGSSGIPLDTPHEPASDYRALFHTYRIVFDRLGLDAKSFAVRDTAVRLIADHPKLPTTSTILPELGNDFIHLFTISINPDDNREVAKLLREARIQPLNRGSRTLFT